MELGNEFEQLQGGNAQEKDAAAWFKDKTLGYQIEAYEEEDLKLQNEDSFDKKSVTTKRPRQRWISQR